MVRFIFKFDEERLIEEEDRFLYIMDSQYKCVAEAVCVYMFELFKKEGMPVVDSMFNMDEFQFDIVSVFDIDKIREVVNKIGFEVLYDSEDNYIHIDENCIYADYINEKGLHGIEFAGEKIGDVITSLTIYFDRGDNEEDIINNL